MKAYFKLVIFFSISLLFLNSTDATESDGHFCGTDELLEMLIKEQPELLKKQAEFEAELKALSGSHQKSSHVKVIPVVFHIIHDGGESNISREQIVDALRILNEDFRKENADFSQVHQDFVDVAADAEIVFNLATRRPNGNPSDGINRIESEHTNTHIGGSGNLRNLVEWDNSRYLNIYIVSEIAGGGGGTILGYATFPWGGPGGFQGIVQRHDHTGRVGTAASSRGRTLTHEAGHYLGLLHTFQGGCHSEANCSTSGDLVCDTPPTAAAHFQCNQNHTSCGGLVNVQNHMDYSSCRFMFTEGQADRMQNVLSQYRNVLVSGPNLSNTGALFPNPGFKADYLQNCKGTEVSFTDLSVNGDINEYIWVFEGADIDTSFDQNPTVTFTESGYKTVSLTVTNDEGSRTVTYEDYILIHPTESEVVAPIAEEMLADSFIYEESSLHTPVDGFEWSFTNVASTTGESSIYLNIFESEGTSGNPVITLPFVNLSELEDPVIKFDYAYAEKDIFSTARLNIRGSQNCGISFQTIKTEQLSSMRTVEDPVTFSFIPNEEQWEQYEASLEVFKDKTSVQIILDANSGVRGNNLFIDNIRIEEKSTTSLRPDGLAEESLKLEVYPNPFSGEITLNFTGSKSYQSGTLIVTDLTGRTLQKIEVNPMDISSGSLKLNAEELNIVSQGMYYFSWTIDSQTTVKRVAFIK